MIQYSYSHSFFVLADCFCLLSSLLVVVTVLALACTLVVIIEEVQVARCSCVFRRRTLFVMLSVLNTERVESVVKKLSVVVPSLLLHVVRRSSSLSSVCAP